MRKSSTHTIMDYEEGKEDQEGDEQTTTFNGNASRFDEEQIANCKIIVRILNFKHLELRSKC